MDQFSGLEPQQQAIAGIAFLIAMGVLAAWSKFRGHREGPPKPKVQEFAVAGQLADMGPVKELVEQTGLLFQQQVRTNIHLEANATKQGETAAALHELAVQVGRLADAYETQMAAERNEAEIEEEVQRRFEREMDRERRARRRVTPRRKPAE